jgi:hypothetical protein
MRIFFWEVIKSSDLGIWLCRDNCKGIVTWFYHLLSQKTWDIQYFFTIFTQKS